ncbi:hypothetical protein [Coleofasciculus sp. FACHB-1120]|uniref:hypothetical protein n=1 Tax=Coleofasciculus sp. FACHB-1120 TaxID=2692783 RepID=UPI00168929C1|nr:hypothetical protein [Coleofasciculus sp. FACHB-1120]MBD2741331.1 hypothetical protein [Coleofasciculus sp. FACHB-1120]
MLDNCYTVRRSLILSTAGDREDSNIQYTKEFLFSSVQRDEEGTAEEKEVGVAGNRFEKDSIFYGILSA